jgi:hypothetical protein
MKKLLPLVLLFIGLGAGVGAGIFLRPDPAVETIESVEGAEGEPQEKDVLKVTPDKSKTDKAENNQWNEYVKLNNQFVVPIVGAGKVTALVVLALSIEVPAGGKATVHQREPKLRDSFLQVLFDHANMGGFDGNFTNASILGQLREALREVAQQDLGTETALDVLIVEIARQDY